MSISKACWIFLVLLISPAAVAQDDSTGLQGAVREPTGAPVSGAVVMVRDMATGQERTVTSNLEGKFEVTAMMPGGYEVMASGDGFSEQHLGEMQISRGQLISVNFTLQPSSQAQEQKSIQPESPAAGSGAAANRISQEQLVGLPLNGRSYNQLATLQAGVSDPTAASGSRGLSSGGLNVVGGRNTSNNYLQDGTNIMDDENLAPRSAAGVQLGSDAVLQVQVLSANYGAEYGRGSGGVLNSISRSGSSEIHGTLFEYFRNSKLDARNVFDGEAEPPPFKRNQFGATFSGPIRKDKLFFLVSYEAMRDRLSLTTVDRFPDENARQGLLPDPMKPGAFVDVGLHPGLKPYLDKYYPIPNSVPLRGGIRENVGVQFLPTDENFFTTRIDYALADRNSLFVHYTFDDATGHSPQSSILYKTRSSTRQQYLTLVDSQIFSLNTVNIFRFGYTRPASLDITLGSIDVPPEDYFFPGAPKLGEFVVPGLSTFGPSSPQPETSITNTFQFSDDLIVQQGRHTLKFGGQIHRYRWDVDNSPERGGQWNFSSLEKFLKGGPAGTNLKIVVPGSDKSRAYRQTLFGFYFQDIYNVTESLEISAGLRYEFATLLHERDGKEAYVADLLRDQKVTVGPMLAGNPSLKSLAPRLSITWSPNGSPNTVLSGGFGIYYDQMLRYAQSHRDTADPFYKRAIKTNFDASPYFPNPVLGVADWPYYEVRGLEYNNTTIPTVLRYTFAIQRILPAGWRVQGRYVGARGNHLYRGYEVNKYPFPIVRPDGSLFFPDDCNDPAYQVPNGPKPSPDCQPGAGPRNPAFPAGILLTNSDGQSFYNTLQLTANKNLSHGLSLQASYTLSKSVDDSSSTFSESSQYGLMRTLSRGLSDFDIRHRLVLSYFYNLPLGSGGSWGKTGFLSKALGGWRLGGIVSLRNGTPFTASIRVSNPGYWFAATQPNLVAGRSNNPTSGVSAGCDAVEAGRELRAPELYFDPCSFQVPEPGTIGNVGRNTLISPTVFTADISVQREFLLDAERRLQFRAELFNFPNHTNFGKPSSGVFTGVFPGRPNSTAGRISGTNTTSRQIQFALKLSF